MERADLDLAGVKIKVQSLMQEAADDVIERILEASALYKSEKLPALAQASIKLNLLRLLVRLAHDTKAINGKHYTSLQQHIDEIGRMLGGWLKSLKAEQAPV